MLTDKDSESISKDRLFSIIAHDLRNPISGIKALTKFLVNDFDSLSQDQIKQIIRTLSDASESVSRLLETLLEWSASQDRRLHLKPEQIDLHQIVSNKIELLIDDARRKHIRFNSTIEENTYVFADARTIKIIIRNLVSNAVKFTPPDGEVKISAKDAGGFTEITVSDTGAGIRKEDAEKLFSSEGRFHIEIKSELSSGLGLRLCKDLVEKNGGEIRVESELGRGSDFTFSLPKKRLRIKIK